MPVLVYKETGLPVRVGDTVTCFRNETAVVEGWREPHKAGSTGRIWVKETDGWHGEYFPSVYGMEWRHD